MSTLSHHTGRARAVRTALALAAALAVLAACSAQPGEAPAIDPSAAPADVEGSITILRNPAEITDETIADFNKVYPGIKVEAIDYDPVKFKAMLAAGEPPDLIRTEAPGVATLVGQGQLMDLTAPLKAIGITDEATFDAAELYVVDGKRYGLPFDWSPDFTIFTNNALFEQAGIAVPDPSTPLSWDEVADLARQLTVKSGSTPAQLGLGGAWDTFSPARVISTRLAESGETLYAKDQKSMDLVSNKNALEALKFMADLAKEGVTHSPVNPSASWSGDEFTQGKIAMVVYGYWFNGMLNSGETAVGTNYTVLPAPYWSDPKSRVDPTITGTGYVMSSKAKDPQAAWSFYSWYMTGQRAQDNAKTGRGFPVLESNSEFLPKEQPVDAQAYEIAAAEAAVAPALQFNRYYDDSVFTNSYNKNLQGYIDGSMTIDQMAANIETDVTAAIDDGVQQQQ